MIWFKYLSIYCTVGRWYRYPTYCYLLISRERKEKDEAMDTQFLLNDQVRYPTYSIKFFI